LQALETGISKSILQQRLSDMADILCKIFAENPDAKGTRALHKSLLELEKIGGLLEVNLSVTAAIEHLLLQWLRAWSQRK